MTIWIITKPGTGPRDRWIAIGHHLEPYQRYVHLVQQCKEQVVSCELWLWLYLWVVNCKYSVFIVYVCWICWRWCPWTWEPRSRPQPTQKCWDCNPCGHFSWQYQPGGAVGGKQYPVAVGRWNAQHHLRTQHIRIIIGDPIHWIIMRKGKGNMLSTKLSCYKYLILTYSSFC